MVNPSWRDKPKRCPHNILQYCFNVRNWKKTLHLGITAGLILCYSLKTKIFWENDFKVDVIV
jgi:hypothetical protein